MGPTVSQFVICLATSIVIRFHPFLGGVSQKYLGVWVGRKQVLGRGKGLWDTAYFLSPVGDRPHL